LLLSPRGRGKGPLRSNRKVRGLVSKALDAQKMIFLWYYRDCEMPISTVLLPSRRLPRSNLVKSIDLIALYAQIAFSGATT
jgi:hypothetical protein